MINSTMSSLSIINPLDFATKQINIYFGLSILILSIIGNLFNIITFRTRKPFRKTSCAFYLTMASIFNAGQLITDVFISILAAGFNIDPTGVSSICKIRKILAQWFGLLSLNSICLAIIDRFFSIKYHYSISLKSASSFIVTTCLLWSIHDIFFILSYDILHGLCRTMNTNFEIYIIYFHFSIPLEFLPLTIMIIFTFLTFINVQKNIVHSNRDRELTTMTLIQITFIVIATIPFIIGYICSLNIQSKTKEDDTGDRLIDTITNYIYYTTYSVSLIFEFDKKNPIQTIFGFFRIHFIFIVLYQNVFVNNFFVYLSIFI